MSLKRNNIIDKAFKECLTEMYLKAQPSADYSQLVRDVKEGKIIDEPHNPVYNRHYLSYEEFHYILDKYIEAYGMKEQWSSNIDIVERYFKGNGRKDIWVPDRVDDDGFRHPGYRDSEKVPHIKKQFIDFFKSKSIDISEEICEELSNIIFNNIEECKNFYRFDREESSFSAGIALGCSPSSNKESVIKYWKEQGIDITIEDRNPMLFWDMDDLGDEFEEVMIDEYGKDWKNYWWKKYYKSNDGKKKMISNYIHDNKEKNPELDKLFVRKEDDDKFYVIKFDDDNYNIPIDEFIEKYNIPIPKH